LGGRGLAVGKIASKITGEKPVCIATGIRASDRGDHVLVACVGDIVMLAVLCGPEKLRAVGVLEKVALAILHTIAAQLQHN
jgi:hypothetical protein